MRFHDAPPGHYEAVAAQEGADDMAAAQGRYKVPRYVIDNRKRAEAEAIARKAKGGAQ